LYNIGIGASELCFTYEGDPNFSMIPTYTTCFSFKGDSLDIVPFGEGEIERFPGLICNPAMILHGEQETEIFKHPLPLSGTFENRKKVIGAYDKGSGALIVSEGVLYCKKTGQPIVRNVQSTFVRGLTGFGGERGPSVSDTTPTREPDVVHKEFIPEFQAQLYRLSGDYNPLHIDPTFSSMVGYQKPILHGLCSFGYACRAVLKHFCNNNTGLIKLIKTRFTNPVLPGSNLITKMWKEGNRVYFQSNVEGSTKAALSAACVELNVTNVSPNAPKPSSKPSSPTLKSKVIFDTIEKKKN